LITRQENDINTPMKCIARIKKIHTPMKHVKRKKNCNFFSWKRAIKSNNNKEN